MREVADNQAVRHTTMLVNHQEVGHGICSASFHQLFELIGAPVQPLSSREDEPELFGKLLELARRVPACRDHDLWVLHACPPILMILTVCEGSSTSAALRNGLLGPSIVPEAGLRQLQSVSLHIGVQEPVTGQSIADALFLVLHSAVLCFHFFSVQVLPSFP